MAPHRPPAVEQGEKSGDRRSLAFTRSIRSNCSTSWTRRPPIRVHPPEILVQVDLAGETTKFGAPADQARGSLKPRSERARCGSTGLMLIPPWNEDQEQTRPWFARLRALRDGWLAEGVPAPALRHLSMGMSHDFEAAIEEGATLVRVGTAIFGKRTVRA